MQTGLQCNDKRDAMKTFTPSRREFLNSTANAVVSALPLLSLSPTLLAGSSDRYGIKGKQAPPLHVDYWIDASGKPATFSQQQVDGKWVYLKCFQNWCPGCHEHGFPALKKVADAFLNENRVEVLAIQTVFEGFSSNTREKVRELQLRYELPIMMGHDAGDPKTHPHPKTMQDYRTGGTPWVVIINPKGEVIYNHFHINPDRFIAQLKQTLSQG
jgi:thiol-disulfide isomerase/thioredoxin